MLKIVKTLSIILILLFVNISCVSAIDLNLTENMVENTVENTNQHTHNSTSTPTTISAGIDTNSDSGLSFSDILDIFLIAIGILIILLAIAILIRLSK